MDICFRVVYDLVKKLVKKLVRKRITFIFIYWYIYILVVLITLVVRLFDDNLVILGWNFDWIEDGYVGLVKFLRVLLLGLLKNGGYNLLNSG